MRKPIVGKIQSLAMMLLASMTATAPLGPALIGLLSLSAGQAQVPTGISGSWNVTSSFGNTDRQDQIQLVMVLHQNGSEITGSIGPSAERQVLTISNSRIEGDNVSLDIGNEQGKITVQFQLEAGTAEGRFRSSNQQGVTIQGTGNGQVQADRMTFQWSATRGDQRLQGKLELTKAEK